MSSKLSLAIFLVAACGGSSSPSVDAPASNVPAMITISGVATQQSTGAPAAASGVTVAAYRSSDENTVIAMGTTDGSGAYSLSITTNGQPLDGFLKATLAGNADTYLFPPAPLTADFTDASINELTTSLYGTLVTIGHGAAGQGLIALEVTDATMATVAGATVTSTPAAGHVGYTGAAPLNLPDTSLTATIADGRAYLFGLAPGSVTVSATATGATFKSHAVKTYADAFTTTVITP